MKKFLALVLAILLTLSVAVVAVSAAPTYTLKETFTVKYLDGVEDEEIAVPEDVTVTVKSNWKNNKWNNVVTDDLKDVQIVDIEEFVRPGYVLTGFKVSHEGISNKNLEFYAGVGTTFNGLLDVKDTEGKTTAVATTGGIVRNGQVVTLEAQWEPVQYEIEFDTDVWVMYGSTPLYKKTMPSVTLQYGTENTALPAMEIENLDYHFIGWKVESADAMTAPAGEEEVESEEYIISDAAELAEILADESVAAVEKDAKYVSLKLIAQWEKDTYTIKYNAGEGGEGEMEDDVVTCREVFQLSANEFTKTGYTFAEWAYEQKVCDLSQYTNGFVLSVPATAEDEAILRFPVVGPKSWNPYVNGDEIEFVAQWTANNYTVKFDANGAEGEMEDIAAVYDEAFAIENGFTKKNYHLIGWLDKEAGKTYALADSYENLTAEADGEVVLYAVWEGDARTVTYTDGVADKEIFKDQVYDTNYDATTPAFVGTPTRDGYTFKGWDKEVAETVTDNVVYTAVWIENPKTGDATPVVLFAALALVSVMGMGFVVVRKNLSK